MKDFKTKEIVEGFITEARELIDDVMQILAYYNKDMNSDDYNEFINRVFRLFHTLKATSGFLNFPNINELTHAAESLLDFFRENNNIRPEKSDVELLYRVIDFLELMIKCAEQNLHDEINSEKRKSLVDEINNLINQYENSINADIESDTKESEALIVEEENNSEHLVMDVSLDIPLDENKNTELEPAGIFTENISDKTKFAFNPDKYPEKPDNQEHDEDVQSENQDNGQAHVLEQDDSLDKLETQSYEENIEKPVEFDQNSSDISISDISKTRSIRVSTDKLDRLFDLVGELMISESLLVNHPDIQQLKLPGFSKTADELNKMIRELQEITLSIRMLPLGSLFNKLYGLIKKLCFKLDKNVEIIIKGKETEIDKNLFEKISDPLFHVVRNAIDHGIENKEKRKEKGKSEKGLIEIDAYQEASEVVISVKDDGAGLDKEKIIKKAKEKGILKSHASSLPDEQVYELLFEPGFSTADKITDISGRGVGLDVIKKNIEELNGSVSIESEKDKYTEMQIRVPLTMAIIDAIIFTIGNNYFAIPMDEVKEFISEEKDNAFFIEGGKEFIKLRGKTMPVVKLDEMFETQSIPDRDAATYIVISRGKCTAAFVVDKIIGNKQLVIKSMPGFLKETNKLKGCSIIGNGDVCMILNTTEIVKKQRFEMNDFAVENETATV